MHSTITAPSTAGVRVHVLDGTTGRRLSVSGEVGIAVVAPGLRNSVDRRSLERVTDDGRVLWRRSLAETFGGSRTIPVTVTRLSRTRYWINVPSHNVQMEDGRYVGALVPEPVRQDVRKPFDLSRRTVSAVDARTGRRLWTTSGAGVSCGRLRFDLEHPVRCRVTGHIDRSRSPDDVRGWRYPGLDVTLEGFDPATGASRWTWHAGAVPALATVVPEGDQSVVPMDAKTYRIRTPNSGTVTLDLDMGPKTDGNAAPAGWCVGFAPAAKGAGENSDHWLEPQTRWSPCDPAGKALFLPGDLVDWMGARSGDVFAWPGGQGVKAVHIDSTCDRATRRAHFGAGLCGAP